MRQVTHLEIQRSLDERLAMTQGVIKLFDSWGLHSQEMLSLLDIPGKPRHINQYRYNKALPDHPAIGKRLEYLVRIGEALRTTYPTNPSMGKRWLRQRSRIFSQRSPLSVMMGEGEQGMVYVLSRLDCTFAWDQSGSKPVTSPATQ
jgi:hypothetical protein